MTYAGILASRHDTAERIEHDHYPTPDEPLKAIARSFHYSSAESILDIGAGDGRFGLAFAEHCLNYPWLEGVEIRDIEKPTGFNLWHNIDFLAPMDRFLCGLINQDYTARQFDFVVANPPFKIAEQVISVAMPHMATGGRMLMLLPDSFLYTSTRYTGILRTSPPYRVIHIADRIDFTGSGSPHQNMILCEWRGGYEVRPNRWKSESWAWKDGGR